MSVAVKHHRPKKTLRKPPIAVNSRSLRQKYGISQSLLARLMNVSLRTVSGLESAATMPTQLQRNLIQVRRLCDALAEAMESTHVGRWLDEPNEMLADLKPVETIERGQIDRVWQVVDGLRSGSQL
jgi:transcriptional regulator with XRE-family HTH domain